jgi:hypothetical protein
MAEEGSRDRGEIIFDAIPLKLREMRKVGVT